MHDHLDIDRITGADAYGSDGDKIGSIDTIFLDDQTNEPKFVLVNTGLFGTRSSFVPVAGARMEGDDLHLAHSKDTVKDAPNIDADDHLSPAEEQELFRYYGLSYESMDRDAGGMGTGADQGTMEGTAGTVGHDVSGPETDSAMTRSEEEMRVGTERHEAGRARLRKHVVTEHVTKTVPVQREEVRVEREPITDANADDAMDGPALSEEEHEVVLHEEEPVVEKRTVPKERVRLEKDVETEQRTVEDDVAREEIDVAGVEESRQHR